MDLRIQSSYFSSFANVISDNPYKVISAVALTGLATLGIGMAAYFNLIHGVGLAGSMSLMGIGGACVIGASGSALLYKIFKIRDSAFRVFVWDLEPSRSLMDRGVKQTVFSSKNVREQDSDSSQFRSDLVRSFSSYDIACFQSLDFALHIPAKYREYRDGPLAIAWNAERFDFESGQSYGKQSCGNLRISAFLTDKITEEKIVVINTKVADFDPENGQGYTLGDDHINGCATYFFEHRDTYTIIFGLSLMLNSRRLRSLHENGFDTNEKEKNNQKHNALYVRRKNAFYMDDDKGLPKKMVNLKTQISPVLKEIDLNPA